MCLLCSFVFMGTYAASQVMYQQIEMFISLDSLRAVLSNPGQIMPDVQHGLGGELMVIWILAVLFSVIYTRRYHCQNVSHSPTVFAVLCAISLTSGKDMQVESLGDIAEECHIAPAYIYTSTYPLSTLYNH